MLDSNLGEMADDVLQVGIGLASGVAAKVVEPLDVVKEVVGDGNDDGNTNGESPDDDNGNDTGVAILRKVLVVGSWVTWLTSTATEPSEDTE